MDSSAKAKRLKVSFEMIFFIEPRLSIGQVDLREQSNKGNYDF